MSNRLTVMIEALVAAVLVVIAWLAGKRQAKGKLKEEYRDTKGRIDSVSRVDGPDVVDRLREHSKRR